MPQPRYHIRPPEHWINDPNGPYRDPVTGKIHLYMQYNPWGALWGNMSWYHVTSEDYVKWRHEPVAMYNDLWYNHWGVYSGGMQNNNLSVPVVVYTCVEVENLQRQCIANPTKQDVEGRRLFNEFVQSPLNPIITEDDVPGFYSLENFRDPTDWWVDPTDPNKWLIAFAVRATTEADGDSAHVVVFHLGPQLPVRLQLLALHVLVQVRPRQHVRVPRLLQAGRLPRALPQAVHHAAPPRLLCVRQLRAQQRHRQVRLRGGPRAHLHLGRLRALLRLQVLQRPHPEPPPVLGLDAGGADERADSCPGLVWRADADARRGVRHGGEEAAPVPRGGAQGAAPAEGLHRIQHCRHLHPKVILPPNGAATRFHEIVAKFTIADTSVFSSDKYYTDSTAPEFGVMIRTNEDLSKYATVAVRMPAATSSPIQNQAQDTRYSILKNWTVDSATVCEAQCKLERTCETWTYISSSRSATCTGRPASGCPRAAPSAAR
eukprot:gene27-biopygen37